MEKNKYKELFEAIAKGNYYIHNYSSHPKQMIVTPNVKGSPWNFMDYPDVMKVYSEGKKLERDINNLIEARLNNIKIN